MATKTKIIEGITVVSDKERKLSYGFKRTGPNTVAVTTAICAVDDKFKHKVGQDLVIDRFVIGETMNLRIPSGLCDPETTAAIVDEMMDYGNI